MSVLVFDAPEVIAEYVGRLNGKRFTPPYAAFGVVSRETLTGGFVFTDFHESGVELSIAGRGCMARGPWAAVLDYVFGQLACARMQVHTRADNKTMRRILPRLGLKFEGRSRRFYGDTDGLCYSLTVDDLATFRIRWGIPDEVADATSRA